MKNIILLSAVIVSLLGFSVANAVGENHKNMVVASSTKSGGKQCGAKSGTMKSTKKSTSKSTTKHVST